MSRRPPRFARPGAHGRQGNPQPRLCRASGLQTACQAASALISHAPQLHGTLVTSFLSSACLHAASHVLAPGPSALTQPHALVLLYFAYLGWRFLGGTPPPCASPLDGPPACPPLVGPTDVDVVTVALAPSCVNAAAVASLNRNLAPKRLFVVTHRNESCPFFWALAPNVVCLVDDHVMPGALRIRGRERGRCGNLQSAAVV
jgi:hypothetical protein